MVEEVKRGQTRKPFKRPENFVVRFDAERSRCLVFSKKRLTIILSMVVLPASAMAQNIGGYFPILVPGYDRELGITVLSRVRPLYEDPGVRYGGFVFRGGLDEAVGYNNNLLGLKDGQGNWVMESTPSLSVSSNWSRNRVGASIAIDNVRYLNQPEENYTNLAAALGGSYIIGRGEFTAAYAHLNEHQLPTEVGALATSTPVPYSVDNVRSYYAWDLGRVKITPTIDYSAYRYGDTTIMGIPSNQSYRDRDVVAGGVTTQYEFAEQRSLLIVAQGFDTQFIRPVIGTPSLSSDGALFLGGVDYQYDGVWRYRILAGVEARRFATSQFQSRVAAVGEGQVVWTPTNLLTLTGTASRTIEDPSEQASEGFTYTTLQVVGDYEFRRNVLLQGRVGLTFADNLQGGGRQQSYYGGAQITWLLNRNLSVSTSFSHISQRGSVLATSIESNLLTSGQFDQNVALVSLHFRL